jgi:hypothetical protein
MSSYLAITGLPRPEDIDLWAHTTILVADSRVDQGRVRVAIDAVFAGHPALGVVFEAFLDKWASRLGGGWGWAVKRPGVVVADVIASHRQPPLHGQRGMADRGRRLGGGL